MNATSISVFRGKLRQKTNLWLSRWRWFSAFVIELVRRRKRAYIVLKQRGPREFLVRSCQFFLRRLGAGGFSYTYEIIAAAPEEGYLADDHTAEYDVWIEENEKWNVISISAEIASFDEKPVISIATPVWNTPPAILDKCVESVLNQFYPKWELCLFDDASDSLGTLECLRKWQHFGDERINVVFGKYHQHISGASNSAIQMAKGSFMGLLDHDDELSPAALYHVVKIINEYPEVDFIYSDEDKIDPNGHRTEPFFKPDWSPDLFLAVNYLCHFVVMRKSVGDQIGWFRKGYEGAQDFDLFLRFLNKTTRIAHIPAILYHWRISETSAAGDVAVKNYAHKAGLKALRDFFSAREEKVIVQDGPGLTNYHVVYSVTEEPLVSIIIPFKDRIDLLENCVNSILEKTSYRNYEILLVSNASQEATTFAYLNKISEKKIIKVLEDNNPFNFSRINNEAALKAAGKFLLFLNNDTEVISEEWLLEMLGHANRPEIGAVGAKLYYPDGTIQHCGVIVGIGDFAGHIFAKQHDHETYIGLSRHNRNFLAVTAACMMISREKFQQVGGFNESFMVCGNDVDLCLKLFEYGYLNVVCSGARLVHHESATRDQNPPACDVEESLKRYAPYVGGKDPYHNINLSLSSLTFKLNVNQSIKPKADLNVLDESYLKTILDRKNVLTRKQLVGALDLSSSDIRANEALVRRVKLSNHELQSINWLVPNFDHVLYGGLYTIFRFASYFQRTKNLCNRIVIYDNPNTDVAILKQKVVAEFPDLAQSLFVAVRDIEEIPDCDASIATFWTSCYLNAKFGRTSRKCYFVQDYEPMFYSAGVYHALAMETYKMGFKCIVNTPGLANLLKDKFGAECEFFYPCVDRKIYHITESEINTKLKRKQTRIVIYGRPLHKRNGFELALDVSERLKAQYGSAVQICSAGDEWSPADYGVTETITNLGRLTNLTDVAALYRDSDIGLVLMFTSHPSYQPLEFMACGCAVVTNHNESNTWLLRNRDNAAVSVPFPSALFDAISELIEDKTLRETIVRNGLATISDWNWDSQCEKIYEFIANS